MGQSIVVSSGQVSTGDVVSAVGQEVVQSDGTAVGTTVLADGYLYVEAGGLVIGATLSAGGPPGATLLTYGTTTGTTLYSAALEEVEGGTDTSTTINNGGFEGVVGGTVISSTVRRAAPTRSMRPPASRCRPTWIRCSSKAMRPTAPATAMPATRCTAMPASPAPWWPAAAPTRSTSPAP